MLLFMILLRPLYRRRTGLDLPLDRAVDLGLAGVVAGVIHGRSELPPDPPSSPEADVIAASFHNMFAREHRERP